MRALLGTDEPIRMSAYPRPVTHAWTVLRGFSILPPSGENWCELPSSKSSVAGFAKIPGAQIGEKHPLIVLAFLIHDDMPFDVEAVRKMLRSCEGGEGCHIGQLREVALSPAKCLSVSGHTEVGNVIRQIHYACIHPVDPHYVVKLVIAEQFLPGDVYRGRSQLEAMEPEYMTLVRSLQFTALNP